MVVVGGGKDTFPSLARAGLDDFYINSYTGLHFIEDLCVCARILCYQVTALIILRDFKAVGLPHMGTAGAWRRPRPSQ